MVELMFKGRSLEEVMKMNKNDLSKLMGARIRRKLSRGLTEEQKKFLKKLKKKDNIKTHLRDMIVLPEMVGKKVQIYNGKEFLAVEIVVDMIGHYLGEFALTRKRVAHSSPGMGATRSSKYVPLK